MTLIQNLTTALQYLLPKHLLSQGMAYLTHSELKWWKNLFISQIIKWYGVNMQEAGEADINAYPSFNHFFTRALKQGVRPIATEAAAIVSPADGVVSQAGVIAVDGILQAKGKSFTVEQLLGGNPAHAALFKDGLFATIYLSPKDYHRLHMPLAGTLTEMLHVPGDLFSVNDATTQSVPSLFARNERVVCLFETAVGPMALILVGAIFVSSVETVWHGVVTPPTISQVRSWQYAENAPVLDKGAEMGRFNMGSTIIVLLGKEAAAWQSDLGAGKALKMGELIGKCL